MSTSKLVRQDGVTIRVLSSMSADIVGVENIGHDAGCFILFERVEALS